MKHGYDLKNNISIDHIKCFLINFFLYVLYIIFICVFKYITLIELYIHITTMYCYSNIIK